MKKIAELTASDDYRKAIVWSSCKASSVVVEYCDAKCENWKGQLFYAGAGNATEESINNAMAKALHEAMEFAKKHVE